MASLFPNSLFNLHPSGVISGELLQGLLDRTEAESLPHFIRSCVGMDPKTVQGHFASFLSDRSLNPAQIRFIELIIDQLTETGILAPEALYEQPFLAVHSGGPEALFPNPKILKGLLDQINSLSNLSN